nr:hypothetical protein [uncultured Cohaesibacter sp.]
MNDILSSLPFLKAAHFPCICQARRLSASLLFVGLISFAASVHAQNGAPVDTPPEAEAGQEMGDKAPLESDWRTPLLSEMEKLANDLYAQRRLNILLEDKVDYMTGRLDKLEQRSLEQAKRIEALQTALQKAEARLAGDEDKSAQGGMSDPDHQSEMAQKPAPGAKPDDNEQARRDKDAEEMDRFDQFLDMGEAMMRRFFGVVKEFRREFDDNRV